MAQYKVPQDVEADDKLLGPFTFRQFVYLLISGGLIALAVGLFQLFPLLAIIPIPFILFFLALALPLKKDQPMETYLAALISYYLKPHTRLWEPGQRESTIKITAPKIVETSRTRNISGEEVNHRLSFLADIVDTGGQAIKGAENIPLREDLIAEASTASDMFESYRFNELNNVIRQDEALRHNEVVRNMQEAIEADQASAVTRSIVERRFEEGLANSAIRQHAVSVTPPAPPAPVTPISPDSPWDIGAQRYSSSVVVAPGLASDITSGNNSSKKSDEIISNPPKPSIIELANNPDYSIETIAKEAKRINEREGEVFISLH
ncbi:PrgI family protein [Candidatus Saccharibacteria bacterium]|nr:PrgI family protein [Candidatus Saccharibacteria bacterium]